MVHSLQRVEPFVGYYTQMLSRDETVIYPHIRTHKGCLRQAVKILADWSEPGQDSFEMLASGRRLLSIRTKTHKHHNIRSHHKNSFLSAAAAELWTHTTHSRSPFLSLYPPSNSHNPPIPPAHSIDTHNAPIRHPLQDLTKSQTAECSTLLQIHACICLAF